MTQEGIKIEDLPVLWRVRQSSRGKVFPRRFPSLVSEHRLLPSRSLRDWILCRRTECGPPIYFLFIPLFSFLFIFLSLNAAPSLFFFIKEKISLIRCNSRLYKRESTPFHVKAGWWQIEWWRACSTWFRDESWLRRSLWQKKWVVLNQWWL